MEWEESRDSRKPCCQGKGGENFANVPKKFLEPFVCCGLVLHGIRVFFGMKQYVTRHLPTVSRSGFVWSRLWTGASVFVLWLAIDSLFPCKPDRTTSRILPSDVRFKNVNTLADGSCAIPCVLLTSDLFLFSLFWTFFSTFIFAIIAYQGEVFSIPKERRDVCFTGGILGLFSHVFLLIFSYNFFLRIEYVVCFEWTPFWAILVFLCLGSLTGGISIAFHLNSIPIDERGSAVFRDGDSEIEPRRRIVAQDISLPMGPTGYGTGPTGINLRDIHIS